MTTTQLQPRAHAQLTKMREQLLARIEQQRGGKVSRADAAYAHFDHVQDDDGQRNNERDVEFAINENETEQLKDIELALQRIADQSYGLCINCGERIHDKRLEAAPLALRCLPCQTAFEKQPVTI
jgi:DnaK suppressor protein